MKLNLNQICQIIASVLFLIGAVFMLVNTFADARWAFWVGLGFAIVGFGIYMFMLAMLRRDFLRRIQAEATQPDTENKTPSYSDTPNNIDGHEKNGEETKTTTRTGRQRGKR